MAEPTQLEKVVYGVAVHDVQLLFLNPSGTQNILVEHVTSALQM